MNKRILILLLIISLVILTFCTKKSTEPEEKLLPPTNLTISLVENNKIQLTWTDNSTNEMKFIIDRKRGIEDWFKNYDEVAPDITIFNDIIPTNADTVYSYRIRAFNGSDYSEYSIPAGWFSEITKPTNLTLEEVGQDSIKLTWQDNSIGELNFRIDRKIGKSDWDENYKIIGSNLTNYIDYHPSLYDTCYYKIFASCGNSHSQSSQNYLICNLSPLIKVPENYSTIQEAIDHAIDGDTILVYPGTYIENINFFGKNITVCSLLLTTGDVSYISQTIIDGNQNGSVVTFVSGEDTTSVLAGFTITNGYTGHGGGIYCIEHSCPTLTNLIISGNTAADLGGGVCCDNYSSPSLINVIIIGNYAGSYGGGIGCNEYSEPKLHEVYISENSCRYYGGGIYYFSNEINSDNLQLENVMVNNNTSRDGAGIYCYRSNASFINVLITGNSAESDNGYMGFGGGIMCGCYSDINLVNVTITGNSAEQGGGIYCYDTPSYPNLENCILWNDTPQEIYISTGYVTLTYSDVQGGWTGLGNIDSYPLFVDPENNDLHLQSDSQCIDAGNPNQIYNDYDGSRNDMGAYGGPSGDW